MDSNDVKQDETQNKDKKNDKGRQNVLLLTLLAMVGGFAYLYFFTDVIRPQAENKPAEAPVAQVVKKPLPPRDGAAGAPEAKPAAGEQKPAEAAAKVEAPKVEPAKAAPAAVAPVAAPQQKPKEEPKKAEAAKPAEKKTAAPVAEAKDQKKAAAEKKPVAETKKVAAKPASKGAVAASGNWTVFAGSYVLESSLATDQAKIKKAGLEPVIKAGPRKKSMMNRLLLAEYADRAAAKAELDKLKRYTSDAFILDHGSRHYVYAGSYLLDSRAASEKERLASAGFSLTLKREEVSIPSKNLTAGVFADKKAAEAAVKKLKDAGIKATLKQ